MSNDRDGRIITFIGKTGSGKGAGIKTELVNYSRVLVWDVKPEYMRSGRGNPKDFWKEGYPQISTKEQLFSVSISGNSAAFDASPNRPLFGEFCKKAHLWARVNRVKNQRAAIVLEEISSYTNAGKAHEEMGDLIRQVRSTGCDVLIACHRCQEVDKTSLNSASVFHITKHGSVADAKATAGFSGIPVDEILAIKADKINKKFQCIRVDLDADSWVRGSMRIIHKKPKYQWESTVNSLEIQ